MKLVSISVKELKKRLTYSSKKYPLGNFDCATLDCIDCPFLVINPVNKTRDCGGSYGNYDFNKMRNHNFGKLRKVNRSHLLFFEI